MTLLMRDQENIEKGMAQGMEKGLAQGMAQGMEKGLEKGMEQGKVYGAISVYREMGLSNEEISKKIREKFYLTKEKAESYLMAEVV